MKLLADHDILGLETLMKFNGNKFTLRTTKNVTKQSQVSGWFDFCCPLTHDHTRHAAQSAQDARRRKNIHKHLHNESGEPNRKMSGSAEVINYWAILLCCWLVKSIPHLRVKLFVGADMSTWISRLCHHHRRVHPPPPRRSWKWFSSFIDFFFFCHSFSPFFYSHPQHCPVQSQKAYRSSVDLSPA